ncbi:hypothetical protein ACHWQZ_G019393 [Mnemiopsis leidyi]
MNHSNISDTYFVRTVDKWKTTGIITASFDTFPDTTYEINRKFDFLRFYASTTGESNQSLFFRIYFTNYHTDFRIRGKNVTAVTMVKKQVKGKAGDIQISDEDPSFYRIFLGDPGNSTNVNYSYHSTEIWDWFQSNNVRLQDTVRIKNDGRCTVFKYISACSDSKPRLCDGETVVTRDVSLGSSMNLTCNGSGAPYLDVEWTKDDALTDNEQRDTIMTSEADHKLESKLMIENIQTDDLGTWKCKIFNKNFHKSVTKMYILNYRLTRSVIKAPDVDYYTFNDENTEFQWIVQGWPLNQVKLECGDNFEDNITKDLDGYTSNPPQVILTLNLNRQDIANCALKDREEILGSPINITRVGYNCKAGERGSGKQCEVCEIGKTSLAGEGKCFSAVSACEEGYWGYQESQCQACPQSQTSIGAVKIQECFPDVSYCVEGQFGYEHNCTQCPTGNTSFPKTKKKSKCFPDISYCKEGYFGFGSNCTMCPTGKTSFPETKKMSRCFPNVSYCKEGYFGFGSNCTMCPIGKTSFPRTKKKSKCFPDVSYCEEGYFGFGSNCTMCPVGETSFHHTKKEAGCFLNISECNKGQYGFGTNCTQCPAGKTSFIRTKKVTGCFPDISNCTKGHYGYGFQCSKCPEGKTSKALAKLLQECIEDQPSLSLPIGAGVGEFLFIFVVLSISTFVIRKRRLIKVTQHVAVPGTECFDATEANPVSPRYFNAPGAHSPNVILKPIRVRRFKPTGNGIYSNLMDIQFIPPSLSDVRGNDTSYATLDGKEGASLPTENSEEGMYNRLQPTQKTIPGLTQHNNSVYPNSSLQAKPINNATATKDRERSNVVKEGLNSTYSVFQRQPKPNKKDNSFDTAKRGMPASTESEESAYSSLIRLDTVKRPQKMMARNVPDHNSNLQVIVAKTKDRERPNSSVLEDFNITYGVIQRQTESCQEENTYANFGAGKRRSFTSDDNDESAYSCLNKSNPVQNPQVENQESPYSNLNRKWQRYTPEEDLLDGIKSDVEDEHVSTYASVELVRSSRLRQGPTEVTYKREKVEYCTISELRQNPLN